jgi:hypothetical protein
MSIKYKYLILIGSLIFVLCYFFNTREQEFTSERWFSMKEEKRSILVKSLFQKKLIDGKNQKEIIELLGEPSSGSVKGNLMTYIISHKGKDYLSFNVIQFIDIRFSTSNVVEIYRIRED